MNIQRMFRPFVKKYVPLGSGQAAYYDGLTRCVFYLYNLVAEKIVDKQFPTTEEVKDVLVATSRVFDNSVRPALVDWLNYEMSHRYWPKCGRYVSKPKVTTPLKFVKLKNFLKMASYSVVQATFEFYMLDRIERIERLAPLSELMEEITEVVHDVEDKEEESVK